MHLFYRLNEDTGVDENDKGSRVTNPGFLGSFDMIRFVKNLSGSPQLNMRHSSGNPE